MGHKNWRFTYGKQYLRHLKNLAIAPKKRVRIITMAATTTTGFSIPASICTDRERSQRRRRISPQAGRALEALGHAIEYLTDEFIHQGTRFSAREEQFEAVLMLMALNRRVYFECPEMPTFGERCRALLHLDSA
jgi:hypothetical protein